MLLSIENLRVRFRLGRGAQAVYSEAVGRGDTGIGFEVPENTTVALVGESGSGKSVTAMSILNLLPDNAERHGAIRFQGQDLLAASLPQLQALRGRAIACVFQDPMSSLNPVFSVGAQLTEPLVQHLGLNARDAMKRAEALLQEVGMPEPKRRLSAYPHQLSGGQQQRVMIAMALLASDRKIDSQAHRSIARRRRSRRSPGRRFSKRSNCRRYRRQRTRTNCRPRKSRRGH